MNDDFDFFDADFLHDDDDDDFQPDDDNSNDDDDDDNINDAPIDNPQRLVDLQSILLRFKTPTPLPPNQLFIAPLPDKSQLPNSPFTVEQWDLLRHQCGLHFFLLCRSIRFTTFCASSDAITSGLLALLHTYNMVFKSSVETTKNLNDLFGAKLFVPVLGNPEKSHIQKTDQIISFLLQGNKIDDLIELDFFNDILTGYPAKNDKPFEISAHSPWTKEEDELLHVAQKRFKNPIQIQKYVMPGRSLAMIRQHMSGIDDDETQGSTKKADSSDNESSDSQKQKKDKKKGRDEDDSEDDDIFVVSENMRFNESNLATETLPNISQI